jgi:REP element-mobilizing transposase RayT
LQAEAGSKTRHHTVTAFVFAQRKYDYRRRLPHIQKDNHPLFITFTTDHRWQLPQLARDAVLDCSLKENGNRFDLHAGVVMPDHCHLLLTPLRKSDGRNYSLHEIMHAVKGASAGEYRWLWRGAIPML